MEAMSESQYSTGTKSLKQTFNAIDETEVTADQRILRGGGGQSPLSSQADQNDDDLDGDIYQSISSLDSGRETYCYVAEPQQSNRAPFLNTEHVSR